MVELKRTYNCIKDGMTIKNICRHLWGKIGKGDGRLNIMLTFRCNLNCKYCTNIAFIDENATNKELGGENWVDVINRHDRDVTFFGGEPTLHKDIWYILENIKPELQVKIDTNITFDVDEYLDKVKRPVHICASYHPNCGSPQKIIEKILKLRRFGRWDSYGNIHTVGPNHNAVEKFKKAGIKLTANRFVPLKKNINTIRVLCKHHGFLIGPDGFRYNCYSKMCRGLGKQENLLNGTLKNTPIVEYCDDYPFCAECDLGWAKIIKEDKKCGK